MITFDDAQQDCIDISGDTSATTLTFLKRHLNVGYHLVLADLSREVTERTQTAVTVASQRYYTMPSDALFIKSIAVTVGGISYPTEEVPDQRTWDILTAALTGTSDIPQRFFVRQGFGVGGMEIGLLPTPASDDNTITVIYESGDRDLTNDAYTANTVTLANGDATVTGSGTTFTTAMVGRYFKGTVDQVWYRIASFTSTTKLELENVFEGTAGAGLSYTINEVFNIPEDLQILPVYYALAHYYDVRHNSDKSLKFRGLFEVGLRDGKRRWATKTRNAVISGRKRYTIRNPNYPPPEIS